MRVSFTIEVDGIEEILRDSRTSRNISLNDLIHLMSIRMTPQHIQKIESGGAKTVPYETLNAVCEGLGINVDSRLKEACQAQIPFLNRNETTSPD
jgi:transcriptional regulator with XRE-family HTH domain